MEMVMAHDASAAALDQHPVQQQCRSAMDGPRFWRHKTRRHCGIVVHHVSGTRHPRGLCESSTGHVTGDARRPTPAPMKQRLFVWATHFYSSHRPPTQWPWCWSAYYIFISMVVVVEGAAEEDSEAIQEEDDGFANYQATTVDTGNTLLIATLLIGAVCIGICLPLAVRWRRQCRRRATNHNKSDPIDSSSSSNDDDDHEDHGGVIIAAAATGTTDNDQQQQDVQRNQPQLPSDCGTGEDAGTRDTNASTDDDDKANEQSSSSSSSSTLTDYHPAVVSCCTVANCCDEESQRLLWLAAPFMVRAVVTGLAEMGRIAIVGRYVSTRALAAAVIVELILGLGVGFLKGFSLSLHALCGQAVGVGNADLAGRYAQIALSGYVILYVPFFLAGTYYMYDVVIWFGFDAATATMGKDYAPLFLTASFFHGVDNCVHGLLDVAGHETYCTAFVVLQRVLATAGVFLVVVVLGGDGEYGLRWTGAVVAVAAAAGWMVNATILFHRGWLNPYYCGLFGSGWAIWNSREATKVLFGTSVALSVGELMSYGEWEILTILASFLGPAEVAAWGVLGSVWKFLELLVEAVADTAEVRTAFLLGHGQPDRAMLSSYKTIGLGLVVSMLTSGIALVCSDDIPTWFTRDTTLQAMVADVLPLALMGNIVMTMGTIFWTVLGAQGRYTLATSVGLLGQVITLSLAVLSSIVFRLDLKGLAAAYVIGYLVSGTIQSYLVLQTDWWHISRQVIVRSTEKMRSSKALLDEEVVVEQEEEADRIVSDVICVCRKALTNREEEQEADRIRSDEDCV
jgi:multidrug resistance protein, MATE family